jgi:uncharacterized protein (TIGR03086 family)
MDADLRAAHRIALADAGQLVRQITADDLENSTPCSDWTLSQLLGHMIGQHHGFAAAVRTGDAAPMAYDPQPFTLESWDASAAELLAAFEDADPEGEAILIEIAPIALPMSRVVGAQLLDTAVHAWDIAQSLGQSYEPATDLVGLVANIAQSVPDGPRRTEPNSAFAPSLRHSGSAWERALAQLGRDPQPHPR